MFRFTIRDLLWLTVVVALGVGWLMSAWRMAQIEPQYLRSERQLKEARAELEQFRKGE